MYLKIMPPYVPLHLAMVYISGGAEIAGGIGLLIPPVRRAAAWGLVALLIAVFPANMYMATNPVEAGAASLPAAALYGPPPAPAAFHLVGAVVYEARLPLTRVSLRATIGFDSWLPAQGPEAAL